MNKNGVIGYRGYAISVGKVWAGYRLRVVEVDGIVQCFHGEEIVRSSSSIRRASSSPSAVAPSIPDNVFVVKGGALNFCQLSIRYAVSAQT